MVEQKTGNGVDGYGGEDSKEKEKNPKLPTVERKQYVALTANSPHNSETVKYVSGSEK